MVPCLSVNSSSALPSSSYPTRSTCFPTTSTIAVWSSRVIPLRVQGELRSEPQNLPALDSRCRSVLRFHHNPFLGNHRQIMRFPYNSRFMPRYSIVVPLHNEQENVTDLYDRLKAVMEINGESFEIVLVDDGSTDRSFHLLREIAAVDSRVTVVRLRRNFGQTSALAAGFDHARGEYIIAMDGDLQHDR